MCSSPSEFKRYSRQFFLLLRVLRAPVLVALLTILALSFPPQTLEVFRSLVEDWGTNAGRIAGGLALGVSASVFYFKCARAVLARSDATAGEEKWLKGILPVLITYVIAAAPLGGIALGLHFAAEPLGFEGANRDVLVIRSRLWLGAGLTTALLLATLAMLWWQADAGRPCMPVPIDRLFGPAAAGTVVVLLATTILAALAYGQATAPILGVLTVLIAFALFVMYLASYLSLAYNRYGVPLLLMLGIWIAFCGLHNNNRDIRLAAVPPAGATPAPGMVTAFLDWYLARGDHERYVAEKRPYPVYVVAAEGGGLYAAQHAALFLARMQDVCPGFARHTFAVSAVSGGSLGAALFSGLVGRLPDAATKRPCNPRGTSRPHIEDIAARFLASDFFSPLLFATLFSDGAQKLIPKGIPSLDRSWALERSLERAWARDFAGEDNHFQRTLRQAWRPSGAAPAVVFNATTVARGRTELIAPFQIRTDEIPQEGNYLGAETDLPVSSAVSMSSRFPGILPPARFRPPGGQKFVDHVDGGYFDTSGVGAAHAIIAELKRELKARVHRDESGRRLTTTLVDPARNLIRISSSEPGMPPYPDLQIRLIVVRSDELKLYKEPDYGPFLRSVLAVETSRTERARLARASARLSLCQDACLEKRLALEDTMRVHTLDHSDFRLPLGLSLSRLAAQFIKRRIARDEECRFADGAPIPLETAEQIRDAKARHCIFGFVRKEIDG